MAFAFPPPPSRKPGPLTPRPPQSRGNGPFGFRNSLGSNNWYRAEESRRSPCLAAKAGGWSRWGGIIFFHLGGRRGGERHREAGGGGGGRKSREGAACARRLIRCPSPAPPGGAGGLGEGRQDGGGEVGRAGRRCCRRHRRLRSSRLRSFKLAPPRRNCPGTGSRGENGGTRARFTACCFE